MTDQIQLALRELHDEADGLTPALVLETAQAPDHPLHSAFTWDSDESTLQAQARELIRLQRVPFENHGHEGTVIEYVKIHRHEYGTLYVRSVLLQSMAEQGRL